MYEYARTSIPRAAGPWPAACLTALFAASLAACGGGGGSNDAPTVSHPVSLDTSNNAGTSASGDTPVQTALMSVSGRVINVGYLGNTKVCADINDNNVCDSGEPTATTDASGRYALTLNQGMRGVHLLAEVRPGSTDAGYPTPSGGSNPIQQGWTLATPLEYEPGSTSVTANITLISSTYNMRMMSQGHYRMTNRINVLMRAGKTDDYSVGADFDYVASPPKDADGTLKDLSSKLKGLTDYLSARAAAAGAPATLIDTASVLSAWYGTYSATSTPIMDVAKFTSSTATTIATSLDTFGYRYYHTKAAVATELDSFMVDKGGLVRDGNTIASLTSQGFKMASGAFQRMYQQFANGAWTDVSFADDAYLTLDAIGHVQTMSGTDALLPRVITAIDGNMVTYKMPVSGVRYAVEIANDKFYNYYLYDWGKNTQQLTPALYNYTSTPATKPSCAANYNTGVASTSTSPADWYSACITYYLYQYIGGTDGYKSIIDAQAKSEFYDETLMDPLVKLPVAHPIVGDCAAAGRGTVTVAGNSTCNTMTGDARGNHVKSELFAAGGIKIESWTKTDPTAVSPSTTPQQLTLVLNNDGTGTLTGLAATSVASYKTNGSTPVAVTAGTTTVTEAIVWSAHPQNSNIVLVNWPALGSGDSTRALPAHFANADFSMLPNSATSPKFNKLAIALQDGVFMSGEYYGPGYTNNFTGDVYKRMNQKALQVSTDALKSIVGKLYAAGFR
ncbi:MAG: hypothetical protein QM749_03330 [Aquabacterium sp.]